MQRSMLRMENLTLKYFSVRGRCEPIFLMLVDAKVAFKTQIVSLETWMDWRKDGRASPPEHPSSFLPVISFTNAKSGEYITLGETNAILLFLDQMLKSPTFAGLTSVDEGETDMGTEWSGNIDLAIDIGRRSAVLEMSMFYLNKVFQTTRQKEWITGETRSILGKGIVARFLQGLEYHLKLTPDLTPSLDDVLSSPSSAAFVALSFTYDVFPTLDGSFPRCRNLFEKVLARPAVSEFYLRDEERRLKMPWTISDFARSDYIRTVADAHKESDRVLFENMSVEEMNCM